MWHATPFETSEKECLPNTPLSRLEPNTGWVKELHATTYRDGAPLKKQSDLGTDKAGYYKPDKYDIYFYNGESILAGELAPEGWKIPSDADWEQLKNYTGNDAPY